MDNTGIDPFTKEEVYVAKGLRDRKRQQALREFRKPENYYTVREALIQADRADLIAIVRGGRLRVIRTGSDTGRSGETASQAGWHSQ
jgi:hypothetical protein